MSTTTTGTRSAKRMEALSCILSDGLSYSWFRTTAFDEKAVTATILANDPDDEENWIEHKIGPKDVARGLRMFREMLEGKREAYPGQWKYAADNAVRAGRIAKAEDFDPLTLGETAHRSYGWQTVIFDRTNGEDGDYDANTADEVLQLAIYGHVIFG